MSRQTDDVVAAWIGVFILIKVMGWLIGLAMLAGFHAR